jgi:hypothetical protein
VTLTTEKGDQRAISGDQSRLVISNKAAIVQSVAYHGARTICRLATCWRVLWCILRRAGD